MAFGKQPQFTFQHINQSDTPQPGTATPSGWKGMLDSQAQELRTTFNTLVDDLTSTAGASNIGSTALVLGGPTNVGAQLQYLKGSIDATAASIGGKEDSASITTNRKLSPTGDFTGTLNGQPIVASTVGLASEVAGARGAYDTLDDRLDRMAANQFGVNTGTHVKAVWMWDGSIIAADPQATIDVLVACHINRVYLTFLPAHATNAQYAVFIDLATTHGIKVEALFGDPSFAYPVNRPTATALVQSVINYNASVAVSERFYGVHMDVEPYLLPEWGDVVTREQLLQDWYDGVVVWNTLGYANGLVMGASIPFWLDDSPEVIASQPDGMPKPFYQMIIDQYNYVAIMAYRDDPAIQITYVSAELAYCAGTGKVIVAMETTNQGDTAISYFEEGYGAFNASSKTIHSSLVANTGYGGIAIHDYTQFKQWYDTFSVTDLSSVNNYFTNSGNQTFNGVLTMDSGAVIEASKIKNVNGAVNFAFHPTFGNIVESGDSASSTARTLTISGPGGATLPTFEVDAYVNNFQGELNLTGTLAVNAATGFLPCTIANTYGKTLFFANSTINSLQSANAAGTAAKTLTITGPEGTTLPTFEVAAYESKFTGAFTLTGAITVNSGTGVVPFTIGNTHGQVLLLSNADTNSFQSATAAGVSKKLSIEGYEGAKIPLFNVNATMATFDRITMTVPKTPASATATGAIGEVAWDTDYLYIAVGLNQWKRVALSTW